MNLSENYRVVYDPNNVILQFFETRFRKDGKTPYEYQEDTYYPNVKTALMSFLQKSIKGSKSIEDCLNRIKEAEEKIELAAKSMATLEHN